MALSAYTPRYANANKLNAMWIKLACMNIEVNSRVKESSGNDCPSEVNFVQRKKYGRE